MPFAAFEPLSAYAVSILFMGNRVGFVEMAGALCIMVMVWMLSKRLDQMNHHTTHHTNVQANCNIWNSRIFLGGELA